MSSGAVININLKATIAVIDTSVRGKIKSTKSRAVILIEIFTLPKTFTIRLESYCVKFVICSSNM